MSQTQKIISRTNPIDLHTSVQFVVLGTKEKKNWFVQHMESHSSESQTLNCPHCCTEYDYVSYSNHWLACSGALISNLKTLKCHKCHKFYSYDAFAKHWFACLAKHNSKLTVKGKMVSNAPEVFTIASAQSRSKYIWIPCKICGQALISDKIEAHMKSNHSKILSTEPEVQVTQVEQSETSDTTKVPKSVKVRALNFKIRYLGSMEYFMCSYCLMNFDSQTKISEHLETCKHVK